MTITTNISVQTSATGIITSSSRARTNIGPSVSAGVARIGTVDEAIPFGDVANPKEVFLKNLAGGSVVRFGFDGTNYPLSLAAAESQVLFLDVTRQAQTVTAIATVAGTANKWFSLAGLSGTWGVWFNLGGGSTPAGSMNSQLEITTLTDGDTAAEAAALIYAAMVASTAFMADFTPTYIAASAVITITDKYVGTRTAVNARDSGFSVATTATGLAKLVLHAKSELESSVQFQVTDL